MDGEKTMPMARSQPSTHLIVNKEPCESNARHTRLICKIIESAPFYNHSLRFLFPHERFHALLNSFFKVLFNFPSRYLFAIGLIAIFSLRWSLPPTLCCTLKQHDSKEIINLTNNPKNFSIRGYHPPWL